MLLLCERERSGGRVDHRLIFYSFIFMWLFSDVVDFSELRGLFTSDIKVGDVAHMVERSLRMREARGSIPRVSIHFSNLLFIHSYILYFTPCSQNEHLFYCFIKIFHLNYCPFKTTPPKKKKKKKKKKKSHRPCIVFFFREKKKKTVRFIFLERTKPTCSALIDS